jgi:TnpA family transposase
MSTGFLTADQQEQLSTYPKEISNTDLGRFFTLTPTDLLKVSQQRSDHNRIGFALQLCTLRYLGFIPNDLEDAPQTVLRLLAHQLGVSPQAIKIYGERQQTKSDHQRPIETRSLPH